MQNILLEKTRNDLISKSRGAQAYKNKKGNRWEAKVNSKVANTVKDYNKINMDKLWKQDILSFGIKVEGETNTYLVTVEFDNILNKVQKLVRANNNQLDVKYIYKALVEALNSSDIRVDCSCPDFKFRQAHAATTQGYKAGEAENRAARITNPDDKLGAGCKHILCVLNNADWVRKIASAINNYIHYTKENMENLYAKYIFPKIYGISYDKAVQMTLADYDADGNEKDDLESDEALLNLSNALGKVRGRIPKGSNKNPVAKKAHESLQRRCYIVKEAFDNDPESLQRHFGDHCNINGRDASGKKRPNNYPYNIYFSEYKNPQEYYAGAKQLAGAKVAYPVEGFTAICLKNNASDFELDDPRRYEIQYRKHEPWIFVDNGRKIYAHRLVIYYLTTDGYRHVKTYFATNNIWQILDFHKGRVKDVAKAKLPDWEKNCPGFDNPVDGKIAKEWERELINKYISGEIEKL